MTERLLVVAGALLSAAFPAAAAVVQRVDL
jgi:cytochrome bd-type quinol oxidase subunit 2